ncbi:MULTISPECIES: NAD-dependent succinate-semialdehyde dehydrogenase [unclassified Nocardioides]|uniref:NAD-dependent succinate-semialdehyde dehydrogenase n=1 Tax=unclassified Nocardioides TaxID=2615069 RepID=UPI0000571978|nr:MULTISPECIES: NAD-dependent succinate-semialdehyde dehydrogenase [unclassified Nocardioides]
MAELLMPWAAGREVNARDRTGTNLVNGNRTFAVEDPATLELIAEVADHGETEARAAVDRAHEAFAGWSGTSPRQRSDVLRRAYELMLRDEGRLSALIARENGKSLADAASEVVYAAEFFRWYAEEVVRTEGSYGEAPAGGVRTIVHHKPVGVAALVIPWNFPAAMATRKIAPALAAGCTVVLKPAAETPLTAIAIADLLAEAGLPAGVVELVTTTHAGAVVTAWLEDDRVRKVSFTGSTGIGRLLLHQAADRVVNTSMELGGNAAFIVTEDADLVDAVAGAMIAKFRNGGQACTAANRIYVHRDVADAFVALVGAQVEKLSVGAANDGNMIGPLISAAAVSRVGAAVDRAIEEGARVAARAQLPDAPGYFYPPTVLTDVPSTSSILAEEIFGPVAPIATWDDEQELLRQVNGTEYGLAAYVYTGHLERGLRLGERIEAGMVGINRGIVSDPSAPFGGVKQSGLGREGAREGLREFQETQYLSISWDD